MINLLSTLLGQMTVPLLLREIQPQAVLGFSGIFRVSQVLRARV